MNAIISLLPPPYYERVLAIWDDLEQHFGLVGVKRAPYPHFSWQGAETYQESGLHLTLETIAARSRAVMVASQGLAFFPGSHPVLYIALQKNDALTLLHKQLWAATRPLGNNFNPYYAPATWQPHITLAMEDLSAEMKDDVTAYLSHDRFEWQFEISSLSYYQETPGGSGVPTREYLLQAR